LRNTTSQEVAKRKRAGEPADELIAQGRALGDEIARLEAELAEVEGSLRAVLLEIPNLTLATVPAGGEENNIIVGEWGTPRPPAGVVPHWEVGTKLGLFDLERASKVSGSGFVFYRGRGARLIRALVSFSWTRTATSMATRRSGRRCSSIARR
jgi:seryl-tRNA synthetase